MTEPFVRTVDIAASPDAVFDHFVEPELLVRWMGDWARLVPAVGGAFAVDINGVLIRGYYVEVTRPTRVVVAWGEAGSTLLPPASTRVEVDLTAIPGGTRLTLTHHGLVPQEAEKHAIGWPHFLDRLAVAASGGDPGRDPWKDAPPSAADPGRPTG